MSVLLRLVERTGCVMGDAEDRQAYLRRLVEAVSDLDDEIWDSLPVASQDWVNAAIESYQRDEVIFDPESPEDSIPLKRPKRLKKAVEKVVEPVEDVADGGQQCDATRFRRAYLDALCNGEVPKPVDFAASIGFSVENVRYITTMACDMRRTIKLLSELGHLKIRKGG